jgi:DNA polymerase (family 10)
LSDLRELPEVESADIAGSLRRWKETVKDMDLVVATRHPDKVMQAFIEHPLTQEVIVSGSTKTSVRLKHQINVDLRAVSPEQYPYALMHFTGSKEHNTEMRQRAKDRDLKLNEYGLFRGEELIPCANEQQIFEQLDLHYIPPELREATDEFEWAEKQNYPDLIATTDIKGLFHIHTTYSDGTATLEELAASARSLGLEYLGISDHSQSASYAGGLTADDVEEQHFEIDELNKLWNNFKLLKGIESDILPNGSLDYPDEILAQFDFVIASIHSYFKLSEEDMTRRVIIAIENPATTMLGHPTGRLLLHRLPYQINIYKVIDAAIANDVIIEINSNPYRLDLDWRVLDYARNNGLMVSINPDAHNLLGLGDFEYGVGIARKAALCPKHVFNTRDLSAVQKYLAKKSK